MICKITAATADFPELEWEQDAFLYSEDKSKFYIMVAEKDGAHYQATGEYSCGELVGIRDIEEDPRYKYTHQ